jgi:heterodisulfide reductase subunit A
VLNCRSDSYDNDKHREYLQAGQTAMTQVELEDRISRGEEKVIKAKSMVMIQCVGCSNKDRNYCAAICCSHAMKNALKLKEINPRMDIYILFRDDMKSVGFKGNYYRKAANKNVRFIGYKPSDKLHVKTVEEEDRSVLRVTFDYILGYRLSLDADCLVSSVTTISGTEIRTLSQKSKTAPELDASRQKDSLQ